jgi:hypothetical protein
MYSSICFIKCQLEYLAHRHGHDDGGHADGQDRVEALATFWSFTIGELDAEADLPRIAGLFRTYANLGGVTRTAGKERRAPMEA